MRRVQQLVAALKVRLLPVGLHQVAHHRALWVPEDEAAARRLLDRKEVEVLADEPVVAPLGLGLQALVLAQLLLGLRPTSIARLVRRLVRRHGSRADVREEPRLDATSERTSHAVP